MTTIINTPANDQSDGVGWMVSIIILIAVIGLGAYAFVNYRKAPATNNINVTLPVPAVNKTP